MQIIEMSTSYLAQSGAHLAFLDTKCCHVRASPLSPIQCSPCPVAESLLERADCESWDDVLIFSGEVNE